MATQQIAEEPKLSRKQLQMICKGLELLKAKQERQLSKEDDHDMKGLLIAQLMEITRLYNAMEEMKGKIQ